MDFYLDATRGQQLPMAQLANTSTWLKRLAGLSASGLSRIADHWHVAFWYHLLQFANAIVFPTVWRVTGNAVDSFRRLVVGTSLAGLGDGTGMHKLV